MPSVGNRVQRGSLQAGEEPPCIRPSQAEAGTGSQGSLMPGEASCHMTCPWETRYFPCHLYQESVLSGAQRNPGDHGHGPGVPLDCFSITCTFSRHSVTTWVRPKNGHHRDVATGDWEFSSGTSFPGRLRHQATRISVLTLAGCRNDSELLKKHSTLAPRLEILTDLVGREAPAPAFFKTFSG